MQRFTTLLIRAYQYAVSPLITPHCRFHPSCSDYCLQAVERHGARRGAWLGVKRLMRCNPWQSGGFDPVP